MSKRRQIKALCHALAIHRKYGPPRPYLATTRFAERNSWCVSCGTLIVPGNEIMLVLWFNMLGGTGDHWIHVTCPDPFDQLVECLETVDDIVINWYHPVMRPGKCAKCSTPLNGQEGYQAYDKARKPAWYCGECVSR